MSPDASWAGLICCTCLQLKRQILPHNGQLNVPADQWVNLETDLGRKGLEENMSFKTRMKCTRRQVTDWSMMWIREGWDRTCRWNSKRWRKLIPQVRSCMPEWAFRDFLDLTELVGCTWSGIQHLYTLVFMCYFCILTVNVLWCTKCLLWICWTGHWHVAMMVMGLHISKSFLNGTTHLTNGNFILFCRRTSCNA